MHRSRHVPRLDQHRPEPIDAETPREGQHQSLPLQDSHCARRLACTVVTERDAAQGVYLRLAQTREVGSAHAAFRCRVGSCHKYAIFRNHG